MTTAPADAPPSAIAARVRALAEHQGTHWDRQSLTWRCTGSEGKPCGHDIQPQPGEDIPHDIPAVAYKHAAHQVGMLDTLLDDATVTQMAETVTQMAEAMAIEGDDDGCFQECRDYEALAEWERLDFDQAHGYPSSEYEQREYWLRKAAASVAVIKGATS